MRISIGDCRLFVDVEGAKLVPDGPAMREKPTLLLLHGGPGFDHSSYKPSFSVLADAAQLVYYDHRGNGRSDRSSAERWNLAQWGDDVVALCDALGIEKPVVLGQSFGGMVAMAYAVRHPDHPGKLILSSTTARHRLDRVLAAFERLGGAEAREAARCYWEKPGAGTLPDYARLCFPLYSKTPRDPAADARTAWNFDVMFAFGGGEDRTFDLLPELGKVRCPTLVLGGEDDPICPIDDQADIAAALPASRVRFERFPGCGHGVFRDDPTRGFAVIRDFVRS
ncbi:MAG TPA: alpha/beta fold hydrolase [Myxococcota bacterium]|nr:alpha/beta fold hydrolase [Myxococcota bacterium]